jgi:hypothetical protein
LRTQNALDEALERRSAVVKWIAEEKDKVQEWAEKERRLAAAERRSAAKYARDLRARAEGGGGGPASVRKDRAEMEALQATLEKTRLDADKAVRKARASERRLLQLSKDQQAQLAALKEEVRSQAQVKVPAFCHVFVVRMCMYVCIYIYNVCVCMYVCMCVCM